MVGEPVPPHDQGPPGQDPTVIAKSEVTETGPSPQPDPRPAAVTFITTEHFTLQGARAATISESTGRASVFLGAVSGGLIALGFLGQASHLGTAFYAFGLILLPTLAFLGLVTFHRAFQSGREDAIYAQRIAQLRAYYFNAAPEITPYLLSVPAEQRLEIQGLPTSAAQKFLTIAGTIAVITSVLAGAAAGMLGAVISDHSAPVAFSSGAALAAGTLFVLMRYIGAQMARPLYLQTPPQPTPKE
jgi:hypothetical protein